MQSAPPVVAIIGGGFSGTMTAAQLVRQAGDRPVRVVLIDRAAAFAAGVAYRTRDDRHLLNVPVAKMSAWPDQPDSFLDWARVNLGASGGDFVPRLRFGAYLRAQLPASVERVHDDVIAVVPRDGGGFTLQLGRGPAVASDAAVLAIGHREPADPLARHWHGPRDRFVGDPWPSLEPALDPSAIGDEPVAILGSGLTAIDAWLTLTRQPRTAPITLVSRRGLLPRVHATSPVAQVDMAAARSASLAGAIALVRRALVTAADWRGVIDGLRPHSAALWGQLSSADRAAFLRHVRPLWEVHRHRMAPAIAAAVEAALATGALRVIAGKVRSVEATPDRAHLAIDVRGGGTTALAAGWVINCTGPGHHATSLPAPLPSLIAAGLVERDPLGLGILSGPNHEALSAGAAVPGLYVLGTLCKPRLWESTAVPELRVQAETVARAVLARWRLDA